MGEITRKLELLAPARDLFIGKTAIDNGGNSLAFSRYCFSALLEAWLMGMIRSFAFSWQVIYPMDKFTLLI